MCTPTVCSKRNSDAEARHSLILQIPESVFIFPGDASRNADGDEAKDYRALYECGEVYCA
jgi:hypothetical protein